MANLTKSFSAFANLIANSIYVIIPGYVFSNYYTLRNLVSATCSTSILLIHILIEGFTFLIFLLQNSIKLYFLIY